jgi:anti-sigma factor RsiW
MPADRNKDMEALNAFVDGELSPDEHAAVAARIAAEPPLAQAHATLTRLRAGIADYAAATQAPALSLQPRRTHRPLVAAAAALAALLAGVALDQLYKVQLVPPAAVADAGREPVQPASLGSRPMIPDLSAAGLTLVRVDSAAGRPLDHLVAVYTGPRGCRLELHVRPLDSAAIAAPQATHRHAWVDGAAVYELVAFGMPLKRFAVVAEAAERQTRALSGPDQRRLREARRNAPPCVG